MICKLCLRGGYPFAEYQPPRYVSLLNCCPFSFFLTRGQSHFRETRSPSRGGDELGSSISVSIIGEEEAVLDCEVWGTSIQDESVDSNEEIDNEDDDEDIDD